MLVTTIFHLMVRAVARTCILFAAVSILADRIRRQCMGKRTREKFSPMEENRAESSLQTLNDFVPHCYRSGLIEIMALRGCPALDSDPQSIMLDLAFLILIQHGM